MDNWSAQFQSNCSVTEKFQSRTPIFCPNFFYEGFPFKLPPLTLKFYPPEITPILSSGYHGFSDALNKVKACESNLVKECQYCKPCICNAFLRNKTCSCYPIFDRIPNRVVSKTLKVILINISN